MLRFFMPRLFRSMFLTISVAAALWVAAPQTLTAAAPATLPAHPPAAAKATSHMTAKTPPAPHAMIGHLPAANADQLIVTHHSITIDGKPLAYTATTGLMPIFNRSGKLMAHIFFVAYTKDHPTRGSSHRPLTFAFNGGPGAGAVWLHIGCAGPVILKLNPNGSAPPPPYQLVSNPDTWLNATDLVFVDPVGTGYSNPAPGVPQSAFDGVMQDVQSLGNFVQTYLNRYNRWASPIFLAGESYGTTRAAALSDYLGNHDGLNLNGIILISSILNFQTISTGEGNDTPYPLFVPSYTAAAWYHHKLSPAMEQHFHQTLAAAEHWALTDYTTALAAGDSLSSAKRHAIAAQLAAFTGLSERYVLLSNLRIDPSAFEARLLQSQRKIIGRMDTRLTAYNDNPTLGRTGFDPAMQGFVAPFTSAFNIYVRQYLHYKNDSRYRALSGDVFPWNFGPGGSGYLTVTDNLRHAMVRNPAMKVMVCSGYFDLATPFLATIYTFDHLGLNPALESNITEKFFLGGHMLYHPATQRARLAADVRAFIAAACKR